MTAVKKLRKKKKLQSNAYDHTYGKKLIKKLTDENTGNQEVA
jgi:hypothetical protein